MGRKVFISYKYGDTSVQRLNRTPWYQLTKIRDYVDELQELFAEEDQINKGELDGEDLSNFKDETIKSKLRDKIYDSSVTVVLISPGMKEIWKAESDQWIPWEISYSLREVTRGDRTSRRNGVLAVVLPDSNGLYSYMMEGKTCCKSGCTLLHTDKLFTILRVNMFNQKEKCKMDCNYDDNVYSGFCSYIHMVTWEAFIKNIGTYIEIAKTIQENKDDYDIKINV